MKDNRSTINKIYYGFLASGMIEVIFGGTAFVIYAGV